MAASMLDVKAIQQGQLFVRRNVCKLCSRNYSTEKIVAEDKKEIQDIKQASLVRHERKNKWKSSIWIESGNPMWKNAYNKLQIKSPNVQVPTVNHRGVDLPRKVKRDPSTVLKAIAETTQFDDPSVSYSFVDDVSLQFNKFKHETLAAKEEGRKTARHMMQMYEKAFTQFKADPDIPSFNPVSIGYEDTTLSVSALEERIQKRKVAHAVEIYDRLEEQGEEVPIEVEEKLLELICVFNGEDPKEKVPFVPEKFVKPSERQPPPVVEWKGEKADQLFKKHVDAGTVTPYMYNVYVCGLIKYSSLDAPASQRAVKLYEKMKEDSIPVFLCTYNSLMRYPTAGRGTFLEMKKAGLVPTKETFQKASMFFKGNLLKKVLAEMKLAEIDYNFETMFAIYYGFPKNLDLMEELVDYMAEQKTWYLDHPGKNVFGEMMRYLNHVNTPEVLPVVRKLYQLRKDMGIRYKIMDTEYDEKFFLGYFYIMLRVAPFEEFTQAYKDMVPFYLNRVPCSLILERMEKEKPAGNFLINLYEDVFNFLPRNVMKITANMRNVDSVFKAMLADHHSTELKRQFAEVAYVFFTEFVQQQLLTIRKDTEKKALLTYPAVLTSLDVMLNEPSCLDKTWDCYMAYAETSQTFFRKQTLSWEKMFTHLIEVEDKMKIRQFLRKIKVSSSWAQHSFLKDMKEPLDKILEPEDRATLEYILADK